ncbi:hypothetical protein [Hymenobacter rigui]|uniref:STAS/SEC14 domain-containing protein n=1 Tax=Hymenobacter rigui TaxID=334424 RepID=A0A428KEX7_9BACT|nr:hypothetical protein [Hymenobacter rigui]RSK45021.1 hypothetical protein EI291_19480 [Hymenobacter rigui]
MKQILLTNPNESVYCQLTYDASTQWLRVVWNGHVGPDLAMRGAVASLEILREYHCLYLFNDNSRLEGPWFDSVYWLSHEWGPAAAKAGLRYVAHVTRANNFATSFTATPVHQLFNQFEIQIFDQAGEALDWLRSCQAQEQL